MDMGALDKGDLFVWTTLTRTKCTPGNVGASRRIRVHDASCALRNGYSTWFPFAVFECFLLRRESLAFVFARTVSRALYAQSMIRSPSSRLASSTDQINGIDADRIWRQCRLVGSKSGRRKGGCICIFVIEVSNRIFHSRRPLTRNSTIERLGSCTA